MSDLLTGETTETTEGQPAESLYTDDQQATDTSKETPPQAEESVAEGAPEKYEFVAPEGQQFDDKVLDAYSEAARELNLSQESAQKMLDKVAPLLVASQLEKVEAIREGWKESAKSDKEFGGEKLSENLSVAKKALEAFGTPELTKMLSETGLGNHPEVVRVLYRAGKAISEDKFVGGKPAPTDTRTIAEKLYSTHK